MQTLLVKTIGRETLGRSIESGLAEGFDDIIVCSDGADISGVKQSKELQRNIMKAGADVKFITLGKRWGYYGAMLWNVAAPLAKYPYITPLDDDDIFMSGARRHMSKMLSIEPDVDVWIAGIHHKNGLVLAIDPNRGVEYGNVAMPTYKTSVICKQPFDHQNAASGVDHRHVRKCFDAGYKVSWFGKALYTVRPDLEGLMGSGRHETDGPEWVPKADKGQLHDE